MIIRCRTTRSTALTGLLTEPNLSAVDFAYTLNYPFNFEAIRATWAP